MKNECYYQRTLATRTEAHLAVVDHIEEFYNRQRLHSTLGYKAPAETLIEFYPQAV